MQSPKFDPQTWPQHVDKDAARSITNVLQEYSLEAQRPEVGICGKLPFFLWRLGDDHMVASVGIRNARQLFCLRDYALTYLSDAVIMVWKFCQDKSFQESKPSWLQDYHDLFLQLQDLLVKKLTEDHHFLVKLQGRCDDVLASKFSIEVVASLIGQLVLVNHSLDFVIKPASEGGRIISACIVHDVQIGRDGLVIGFKRRADEIQLWVTTSPRQIGNLRQLGIKFSSRSLLGHLQVDTSSCESPSSKEARYIHGATSLCASILTFTGLLLSSIN